MLAQLRHLLDPPIQLGQTELQPAPPAAQLCSPFQPPPLSAAAAAVPAAAMGWECGWGKGREGDQ